MKKYMNLLEPAKPGSDTIQATSSLVGIKDAGNGISATLDINIIIEDGSGINIFTYKETVVEALKNRYVYYNVIFDILFTSLREELDKLEPDLPKLWSDKPELVERIKKIFILVDAQYKEMMEILNGESGSKRSLDMLSDYDMFIHRCPVGGGLEIIYDRVEGKIYYKQDGFIATHLYVSALPENIYKHMLKIGSVDGGMSKCDVDSMLMTLAQQTIVDPGYL